MSGLSYVNVRSQQLFVIKLANEFLLKNAPIHVCLAYSVMFYLKIHETLIRKWDVKCVLTRSRRLRVRSFSGSFFSVIYKKMEVTACIFIFIIMQSVHFTFTIIDSKRQQIFNPSISQNTVNYLMTCCFTDMKYSNFKSIRSIPDFIFTYYSFSFLIINMVGNYFKLIKLFSRNHIV